MNKLWVVLLLLLSVTLTEGQTTSGLPSQISYAVATGVTNALAVSQPGAVLTARQIVIFLPNNSTTSTTPTLNINGLGAKTITKLGTAALVSGDLTSTALAEVIYDGTGFQLQNPQTGSGGGGGAVSSVTNSDGSITASPTTGSVVVSLNLANANVFTANQTAPQFIADGAGAGGLQAYNAAQTFYTFWSSAATANNTINGPATAPVTGDLLECVTSSTTCTLTDTGVLASALVTASSTTTLTNKSLSVGQLTGQVPVANGGTGLASVTAYSPLVGGTTTTGNFQSTVVGTSGQVFVSQGASTKPTYIDYTDRFWIPAANCVNAVASSGWSGGASLTTTCRAGTNNVGGYVAITDTSSSFAQFNVTVPEDYDSGTLPYIRFYLAYPGADGGSSHTIIPAIKVSCDKGDGSTGDDVTFNASHSSSTITLSSATTNLFFSTSNVELNSTDMTGCQAGSMMVVQVGRATDTATSAANFYGVDMTFPRLLVVQAN